MLKLIVEQIKKKNYEQLKRRHIENGQHESGNLNAAGQLTNARTALHINQL